MRYPDQEQLVSELLRNSGIDSPPIKLATIAKHWKDLQITLEDIEGDAFLVDLGTLGSNILIKRDTKVVRQRFSLAHELGHLVLKDNDVLNEASTLKNRDASVERWCNEFASELLMPAEWTKSCVIGKSLRDIYRISHDVAQKFHVSFEASLIRLAEVTPVNIARVSLRNQKATWHFTKSTESPLNIERYKSEIMTVMKSGIVHKTWFIDYGLACTLQAQRRTAEQQNWIAYFAKLEKNMIIHSTRNSMLRS